MDNRVDVGGRNHRVFLALDAVPERGQDMLRQTRLFIVAIQGNGISAVGNLDIQQFFKIIDIIVMFAVEQGNKAEIIKFKRSDGLSPLGLYPNYSTKSKQKV